MTETGNTIEIKGEDKSVTLAEHKDTLTFKVPPVDRIKESQAHLAGTEIKKDFSFGQVKDETEAQAVCEIKGWSLVEFVNDELRNNSRSSAYQSELMLYKRDDVDPEEVFERTVRNLIRMGISEDIARTQVQAMREAAASKG